VAVAGLGNRTLALAALSLALALEVLKRGQGANRLLFGLCLLFLGLDLAREEGQVAIFVGSSQCSLREATSMALSGSMSM